MVSCGALYVVDKCIDIDDDAKVVAFEVCKLDEELGQWVFVKRLGDQVFVLGANLFRLENVLHIKGIVFSSLIV